MLLLARGGGSLEDLWAFNEEVVARAIYDCPIPVVSGVGHEVDVTIADFVADRRAPTPTAAAELVSPDQGDWQRRLQQLESRLHRALRQGLARRRDRLHWLQTRLPSPARQLEARLQRLDELELRRRQIMQHRLRHAASRLATLQERLQQHSPRQRLERYRLHCHNLAQRLATSLRHRLQQEGQRLAHLAHTLESVSPLPTLARGYAIVTTADARIVRRARDVQPGEVIHTRLAEGRLVSTVNEVESDS